MKTKPPKKSKLKLILAIAFLVGACFFVAKDYWPSRSTDYSGYANAPVLAYKPQPKIAAPKAHPKSAVKTPAIPKEGPRMAIILDDWGKNYSALKPLLDLDRPVTLAVLPKLVYSRRIAEEAYAQGMGIMLHMPMEPTRKNQPLEPETIKTTSPDSQVLRYLREAIASVPHVEGVNNHMGSKATSDPRVMKTVMNELKKKKLFFVDSGVVSETQGWRTAEKIGLAYAKRDVFIDNEQDIDYIKGQLAKAKRQALRDGRVVVIGHDKKITIQAIKEMIPEIEKAGIRLILVRDIVNH